jgi:hypothetical protein
MEIFLFQAMQVTFEVTFDKIIKKHLQNMLVSA